MEISGDVSITEQYTNYKKDNLLHYYHEARSTAFKPATIQTAFWKTGIYPLDHHVIPASAFESAKNTTTKVAQPLPAQLPPSLVPTPNPFPVTSAATLTPNATPVTSAALSFYDLDVAIEGTPASANTINEPEPEPVQWYHIKVPPPLPHTASW
jgi:hypothetical protein